MGQIPLDILHVRLFVHADKAAKGVRDLLARKLFLACEEVCRIEREREGALVVEDAAAEKVAFLPRHMEWVGMPARAERHDIGMCDCRYLLVGCPWKVRIADMAAALVRLES